MHDPQNIAAKFLGVPYGSLDERTQKVARHVAERNFTGIHKCVHSVCWSLVSVEVVLAGGLFISIPIGHPGWHLRFALLLCR